MNRIHLTKSKPIKMPTQPHRIRLLTTICANGATDLLAGRIYETCQPPKEANGCGVWLWSESIKEAVFIEPNEFTFIIKTA